MSQLLQKTEESVGSQEKKTKSKTRAGLKILLAFFVLFLLTNLLIAIFENNILYYRAINQKMPMLVAKIGVYNLQPHTDILYMGTSITLSGFDPAQTTTELEKLTGKKVTAFNLGISGAVIELQYYILKNILISGKKPSVIVYGLADLELPKQDTPWVVTEEEAKFVMRVEDLKDSSIDSSFMSQVKQVATQFIPLYRERATIRDIIGSQFNPDFWSYGFARDNRKIRANGFLPWEDGTSAPPNKNLAFLSQSTLDPRRIEFLKKFIALAKENNIKILLVNMPVRKDHLTVLWKSQERFDNYAQWVKDFATEQNVAYLDLYSKPESLIPHSGFLDNIHFNESGAAILTSYVVKEGLAKMYSAN